jgi:hypothetical protein
MSHLDAKKYIFVIIKLYNNIIVVNVTFNNIYVN